MKEILVYLSIIHKGNWNKIYQDILNKRPINKEDALAIVNKLSCSYITILDNNYPVALKSIYKPPFVLFYKGNINLLNDSRKKLAIIGSRNNSDYGEIITETICQDLVNNNTIIVSGLAKGIDSIAHKNCLKNNGQTIAVLGNGIDVIYPQENELLYKEIACKGVLISEYPPGVTPYREHFPERNRIISGISDGIAVMEAKTKSGTMNTVSHGLEDGKQIFCVCDRVNNNSGCNKLIKEGAKLIENAQDILEDLWLSLFFY